MLDERQICQNCAIKFNELDEHQTMVDKIQRDLLDLLHNSETVERKPDIKIESDDDHLTFDEPQELSKRLSRQPKKIKTESKGKKRGKVSQLNQNDPTGFTVTNIDGKLHYKCDICGKVVVRRPQLHLLTHSNEKNVECEECGQFFKSLKCLYGHRKTHGERKYWSW